MTDLNAERTRKLAAEAQLVEMELAKARHEYVGVADVAGAWSEVSGRGWLTNVQRKQLPFATAGALTDTAFDVRKHVVEKTFPRGFDLKNKRFAAATLRVEKANKRKLRAAVYDRLGREYLETQARGGIKKPIDGRNIAIPTQHIKRTASGKVSAAKRPRAVLGKPNMFIRRTSSGGQILQKGRRKSAPLKTLYQLVPLARIPKRLRFYEDAAKVVQRRMVPNFKKSFERAVRTARRQRISGLKSWTPL